MCLEVLSPGILTTVQDLGRTNFARYGVPQSGAMDWYSLRSANHLVGNPPGAAGLEFFHTGPRLVAGDTCLIALAGRGYTLLVQGRSVDMWRCVLVRQGETIDVISSPSSGWGYLAVSGGISVPEVLGSRSTYLRGNMGGLNGRTLQIGDILPLGSFIPAGWQKLIGRRLSVDYRPFFSDQSEIPVILGPQADFFGEMGVEVFLNGVYSIMYTSDRMGYRLAGPPIPRQLQGELLSEGIAAGSVQVPPDGQPIVLLSDRPTTGGYAKIATVTSVGIPILAQTMPGIGNVRFRAETVDIAQKSYRDLLEGIGKGITDDED